MEEKIRKIEIDDEAQEYKENIDEIEAVAKNKDPYFIDENLLKELDEKLSEEEKKVILKII